MLVLLKFYSLDKDPFRSIADHSAPLLPATYLDEEKKPEFPDQLGARLLEYCVNSEIRKAFEVEGRGKTVPRFFLDEEGDRVILDNRDSYLEAWKVIRKNRVSLRVIVGAPARTDIEPVMEKTIAPIPEMSRPHSMSRSPSECSYMSSDSDPPQFVREIMQEMERMKKEIKAEILDDVKKSLPLPEPVETPKSSGAKPKKIKKDKRNKKEKTKSVDLPTDCGLCCRPFGPVRFVCLKCKDQSVMCQECLDAGVHPGDHVMLRIPESFRGKPQRLASNAEAVLLTHSCTCSKGKSKPVDPIVAMLDDAEAVQAMINYKEQEPITIHDGPKQYDMALLFESETRIMNHLSGDTAAYWKRWTVENTGTKPWLSANVQLSLQFTSGPDVQPFAPEACVPALTPGSQGEVVVWVYGPVTKPGNYMASWQMQYIEEDTLSHTFGPIIKCSWEIDEENTTEKAIVMDSKEDDYSIVSTGDDPDFEIVSNANSVMSSFGDSTPSTPHLDENEDESSLEMLSPPNTGVASTDVSRQSPTPESDQFADLCVKVKESLEYMNNTTKFDETDMASSHSSTATAILCHTENDLCDRMMENIAEHFQLDNVPERTIVSETPINVIDEPIDTEIKEPMMTEQVEDKPETDGNSADDQQPTETQTESQEENNNTTGPAQHDTRNAREEAVNRAFIGVARVATSVASTALGTVGSALQTAGRVVQQHAERRWTPPNNEWQPPAGWVPQATQTGPDLQNTNWTPPPRWEPNQDGMEVPVLPPNEQEAAVEEEMITDMPNGTPTTEYPEQLEQLVSMGFFDVDRNASVLRVYNGDLHKTVDFLLCDFVEVE